MLTKKNYFLSSVIVFVYLFGFIQSNIVLAANGDNCRGTIMNTRHGECRPFPEGGRTPCQSDEDAVTKDCPSGYQCCVPNGYNVGDWCCVRGQNNCDRDVNNCNSPATKTNSKCESLPACNPSQPSQPSTLGSGGGGGTVSTDFPNPLQFNTIEEVLNSLMSHLKGLVATLAILFIVLGGVLYITSAGDESMIKKAKACWTAAVIGMAIVLAGPTFLLEVETVLGGNTSGLQGLTLMQIARNVLSLLLSLVGILAIIFLVIGGAMYITASGDDKKIGTGKKIIEYAVYGVIISMGALIIVRQISTIITN